MGWVTGIAVYLVIWWTVLFAVLPWGIRPDDGAVPGSMAGAPARPRLALKAAVTSAVAAVVWLVVYAVMESGWVSFREMALPVSG